MLPNNWIIGLSRLCTKLGRTGVQPEQRVEDTELLQ